MCHMDVGWGWQTNLCDKYKYKIQRQKTKSRNGTKYAYQFICYRIYFNILNKTNFPNDLTSCAAQSSENEFFGKCIALHYMFGLVGLGCSNRLKLLFCCNLNNKLLFVAVAIAAAVCYCCCFSSLIKRII